jgi:glutathione S-transferase
VNPWIVLVTVVALLFYFSTAAVIARSRYRYGIMPPVMTGHPDFERLVRIQANTLEWMAIFLPALWICAGFFDPRLVAGIGAVWVVGRVVYAIGYAQAAPRRRLGFGIQALAAFTLLIGCLAGAVMRLIAGG